MKFQNREAMRHFCVAKRQEALEISVDAIVAHAQTRDFAAKHHRKRVKLRSASAFIAGKTFFDAGAPPKAIRALCATE
ncbi:hypothetical protein [Novosphingobium kaempferiae]|uniref:hypothetical protein n=1 Tax=Novosphingobium kaempferiae TaxID=2896849 RepID=UPI001E50D371|nr:hypothetical protein [Novosphingobium kaempferiae]